MKSDCFEYYSKNVDLCLDLKDIKSHNMTAEHFHKSYEFYYLISGSRNFYIEDKFITLSQNSVVMIAPGVLHKTLNTAQKGYKSLVLNFSRDLIPEFLLSNPNINMFFENKFLIFELEHETVDVLKKFIQVASKQIAEKGCGFEMIIYSELLKLLHHFICLTAENKNSKNFSGMKKIESTILDVSKYIDVNYKDNLNLEMLAEKFFISPSYLSRSFKKYQGISLVSYINMVRINRAKNILDFKVVPAKVLAKECGFDSVSNFNRVFKEITGTSPHKYKNLNKKL